MVIMDCSPTWFLYPWKEKAVISLFDDFRGDPSFGIDADYFKVLFELAQLLFTVSRDYPVNAAMVVTNADLVSAGMSAFWRSMEHQVLANVPIKIREFGLSDQFSVHTFSPSQFLLISSHARHCFSTLPASSYADFHAVAVSALLQQRRAYRLCPPDCKE
jgi:hypothetical protein